MIRRPPRSTLSSSSAASDVYKRQVSTQSTGHSSWRMGWLEAMNPRLPRQAPPTTSAKPDLKLAYWYLAPQQVEAEWWLCILLSGVYGWMADWGVYAQGADTVRTERPWVDGLLLLALTGSYGLMIWHKLVRGGARYLLQPCHMVTLLAILSLVPWPGSQLCFSLTACLAYNPLLALLFPETGSYRSLLEVWNYWVEHLLILSMPFIRSTCSAGCLIQIVGGVLQRASRESPWSETHHVSAEAGGHGCHGVALYASDSGFDQDWVEHQHGACATQNHAGLGTGIPSVHVVAVLLVYCTRASSRTQQYLREKACSVCR
eukprot:TRINITY_DN3176_c0_g1_i7.p1 TRINITY_DN3176_c0_g1~~TRINITY_DN3176_c0_g1_i7.p1  ORF type:complete len:317 (+),score=33.09 TRINITY_DN3176_c0_g1_i7:109-1059(+)